MAKKKDEELIKPQPAPNAGDAVASGLFGGAAFRPTGETLTNLGRSIASGQSPTMMAGGAGVNPLVASGVPQFPSRIGPLISTNYGLPPSDRPDFRDPAAQWDARPVTPAPNSVQSWAATPFRGNAATQAARQYEGLPPHLQSVVDRENMSSQSLGVVDTSRSPLSGINAMPNTSIQGMSVDRTPIASRMAQNTQSFSSQPSFNLAGAPQRPTLPSQPQPLQSIAQNVPQAVRPALTKLTLPSGEAWVTAEQLKNYNTATARTQQEQQAKAENMAQFRQNLTERRADLKAAAKSRDEESLRRSYKFRQDIADERAARETAKAQAEIARGGSGRDALKRAQRYEIEANLAEQRGQNVGTGKKAPFFSWETIKTRGGGEYLPSGMGEYIQTKQAPSQQSFGSPYSSPFSASMEGFSQSPFAPSWMRGRRRFSNFGIT